MLGPMIRRVAPAIVLILCAIAPDARAQDPPPALPPIVIDLQGAFTRLPDDAELADSRGLETSELPGSALGGNVAAHLYLFRYRAVTFGIGGHLTYVGGHQTPEDSPEGGSALLQPVTERVVSGGAQLSFNFGTGDGWSYLSGGIGRTVWQIIPGERGALPADEERLKTLNYGGGARWFITRRLAFSFDVRFHAINPGTPTATLFGSPRTTLMVISVGGTIKVP
jgi:hypothetical protein